MAQYRERLDACRQAVNSIYTHLEENGISVGMVFRLRQLRERMLRVRDLLDSLLSPNPRWRRSSCWGAASSPRASAKASAR
jgi:site-specific recombinase